MDRTKSSSFNWILSRRKQTKQVFTILYHSIVFNLMIVRSKILEISKGVADMTIHDNMRIVHITTGTLKNLLLHDRVFFLNGCLTLRISYRSSSLRNILWQITIRLDSDTLTRIDIPFRKFLEKQHINLQQKNWWRNSCMSCKFEICHRSDILAIRRHRPWSHSRDTYVPTISMH